MKPDPALRQRYPEQAMRSRYAAGKLSAKSFVEFQLIRQGRDLIVKIAGGEAHIGSLAYSIPGDRKGGKIVQHTHDQHREDQIVRQTIERLIDLVEGELIVVGGIHYDQINKDQIAAINENCSWLIERIADDLASL